MADRPNAAAESPRAGRARSRSARQLDADHPYAAPVGPRPPPRVVKVEEEDVKDVELIHLPPKPIKREELEAIVAHDNSNKYEMERFRQQQERAEEDELIAKRDHERQERAYEDARQARIEEKTQLRIEEASEMEYIKVLKRKIEQHERRVQEMRDKDVESEIRLAVQLDEVRAAEKRAEEKRKERFKATREYDFHHLVQASSTGYSRTCTICVNTRPHARVCMVVCGHVMCATCASELQEAAPTSSTAAPMLACPFCRKRTTYVRMFENKEEEEEGPRGKRQHDGQDAPCSSKQAKK